MELKQQQFKSHVTWSLVINELQKRAYYIVLAAKKIQKVQLVHLYISMGLGL